MKKIFLALCAGLILFGAWQVGGWKGVALGVSALVMVLLLQFNRMLHVLKRTANGPKGFVGSAVMLNAKLKKGASLLHVMQMTGSMGDPLTPEGQEPEIFRWHDEGGSFVECEFSRGKLVKWTLARPDPEPAAAESPAP